MSELPGLTSSVLATLNDLRQPKPAEPEKLTPPVPIKKSVTPDYLISLEDGRRYKSLKRHLAGKGLTPAEYRLKWCLPSDYPMTAPAYSERRSQLAKTIGLARKKGEAPAPPTRSRGRKKSAAPAGMV